MRSNSVFQNLIEENDNAIIRSQGEAETVADALARWDNDILIGQKSELKAAEVEKKLDQDMNDLIEYTKWISKESQILRDRVKQEELDSEAEQLREVINTKEVVIK